MSYPTGPSGDDAGLGVTRRRPWDVDREADMHEDMRQVLPAPWHRRNRPALAGVRVREPRTEPGERCVVYDFERERIRRRPHLPPQPDDAA